MGTTCHLPAQVNDSSWDAGWSAERRQQLLTELQHLLLKHLRDTRDRDLLLDIHTPLTSVFYSTLSVCFIAPGHMFTIHTNTTVLKVQCVIFKNDKKLLFIIDLIY